VKNCAVEDKKMFQLLKKFYEAQTFEDVCTSFQQWKEEDCPMHSKHGHNFSLCKYFVQSFSDGRLQFIML
jgi:hypothetical protein